MNGHIFEESFCVGLVHPNQLCYLMPKYFFAKSHSTGNTPQVKFEHPLQKGKLVKRYKRFLADIELENGDVITAHCANPGSMLGLKEPGMPVWVSPSHNPKRKLKYNWELCQVDDGAGLAMVGIHTGHPNKIVLQAIKDKKIPELVGYENMRPEVKYGEQNSRIDILLQDNGKPDCYVEIKNVHLCRQPGLAEFPDAKTTRGKKHLEELTHMVHQGATAVMFYLVQRTDSKRFSLASDIDPEYETSFLGAKKAGVEAIVYTCDISPHKIELNQQIPMVFY